MDLGSFYFLKDEYFVDFPDKDIQINKETLEGKEHGRPSYYAIKDNRNPLIYWVVPISSGVAKYQPIYDKKIQKYGNCDTIHFGYVLGNRKAFLIQNMCPVIDEYVSNQYIDAATRKPVSVNTNDSAEIERKAKKVLMLHRRGINLIFPDVNKIEQQLLRKLAP